MGDNVTEKILKRKLVEGELIPGREIAIKIDQTLTQDATGTMVYLQFETIGIPRVKTELSVSYVDHNTLQSDFKNQDDHRFLQSAAARYGVYFSRPGNGICHQVHLERFGVPGKTLLGSDSHTPTGGGLGMLAIGAGGLDVAAAMAGMPFFFPCPEVVEVRLSGALRPFSSAKDIILTLLKTETVAGGLGRVYEYTGPGVLTLSVPQRASITNMGAELGATSSIFPSDQVTRAFLALQNRGEAWEALEADGDCAYSRRIEIDLSRVEPLAACPHSPDAVKPLEALRGIKVDQVVIGSCTNSSLHDLGVAAEILRGKTVHPRVSLGVAPGSRQALQGGMQGGIIQTLVDSGARLLESACGPCIGMGFAPPSAGVSLRTFNRNFKGRSGTADAQVYLVSPETAAVSALTGEITDPRSAGEIPDRDYASFIKPDDSFIIPPLPPGEAEKIEIIRGPNIKPCPRPRPLPENLRCRVLLKAGDNITTDHIMPAGQEVLPLRSNIPEISKYVFRNLDPGFYDR
ncbi:MAG: aconitate hydratase, partial [Spirochaetales bacterium]|nr:aconitate hydratase [Spirochaetales bacterium]